MVKEIEVDGVKHGITLADSMVGQGLKKDENGAVTLQLAPFGSNSEVPLTLSTNGTLVLKYGPGLQQRDGYLSLRYGTGINIGPDGSIFVNSKGGSDSVIIEGGRALLIGTNILQIGTENAFGGRGVFSVLWEEGMKDIELRISSEEAGVYSGDGTLLLGGLTLSSEISGLYVSKDSVVTDGSGVLNIVLRPGSDILFNFKDDSGDTYQGSVALSKK